MDLKTGKLLWPALTPSGVRALPLRQNVQSQAIVIGAGVTGAMCAYLLAEAGVETLVVDRRGVAEGSTPASTALVQYEIDAPLVDLMSTLPPGHAQAAYRATRDALDAIVDLTHRAGVDCDLHPRGSLYLASRPTDEAWLRREALLRTQIGIEVEYLDRQTLRHRFDIDRPGAILSTHALELDPYKLTQRLIAASERLGVRVFSPVDATPVGREGDWHVLLAGDGLELRCKQLIIATGYETPELFAEIRGLCRLRSTYAVATAPRTGMPPWTDNMLIWDTEDPYFYARQTADHRVIVGGEDEPVVEPKSRDRLIPEKTRALLKKLAALFPALELTPEYSWAGTFAETPDGLPLIGTHPEWPGVHFALGYGGNGITFSVIAAQIIRDAILRRPNPNARLFGFDRLMTHAGGMR